MATFLERAVHSVNHMFSLLCLFVTLVASHFGFEGRTLVLIASSPGHCLTFIYYVMQTINHILLSSYTKWLFYVDIHQ